MATGVLTPIMSSGPPCGGPGAALLGTQTRSCGWEDGRGGGGEGGAHELVRNGKRNRVIISD